MSKILVLEDDISINAMIGVNLQKAGFEVLQAQTGGSTSIVSMQEDIDVAILRKEGWGEGVLLPGISGG